MDVWELVHANSKAGGRGGGGASAWLQHSAAARRAIPYLAVSHSSRDHLTPTPPHNLPYIYPCASPLSHTSPPTHDTPPTPTPRHCPAPHHPPQVRRHARRLRLRHPGWRLQVPTGRRRHTQLGRRLLHRPGARRGWDRARCGRAAHRCQLQGVPCCAVNAPKPTYGHPNRMANTCCAALRCAARCAALPPPGYGGEPQPGPLGLSAAGRPRRPVAAGCLHRGLRGGATVPA